MPFPEPETAPASTIVAGNKATFNLAKSHAYELPVTFYEFSITYTKAQRLTSRAL